MIAAFVVLSVIVLFHELGHFLLAKINGVAVIEFSLGFGPRLLSIVSRRSGTRYSIKCIPFGGSCAMLGEEGEPEDEEDVESRAGEESQRSREARERGDQIPVKGDSFFEKSPFARIAIIAAGPIFNFIMAFTFALVIISWAGYDSPRITGVMEGYPAEAAGLEAGDVITKVGNRKVGLARDIIYYMMQYDGREVPIKYKRYVEETGAWQAYSTVIMPKYSEEKQTYYIGIQWSAGRTPAEGVGELLKYGVYEVRTQILSVLDSLHLLITGKVGTESMAGPVRIVSIISDTVEENRQYGMVTVVMNLLNLAVMFSANLGVMNLLPFPALDGGRLVFLFWELLTRRPVNERIESAVNMTGMALLMTFMVFVIFNDLRYLF